MFVVTVVIGSCVLVASAIALAAPKMKVLSVLALCVVLLAVSYASSITNEKQTDVENEEHSMEQVGEESAQRQETLSKALQFLLKLTAEEEVAEAQHHKHKRGWGRVISWFRDLWR